MMLHVTLMVSFILISVAALVARVQPALFGTMDCFVMLAILSMSTSDGD